MVVPPNHPFVHRVFHYKSSIFGNTHILPLGWWKMLPSPAIPREPGNLTPWIFPDSEELAALHEANAAQEGKPGKQPVPIVELLMSTDPQISPLDPHRWWGQIRGGSDRMFGNSLLIGWQDVQNKTRYQWNQDLFGIPGPLVFFHWWVGNL